MVATPQRLQSAETHSALCPLLNEIMKAANGGMPFIAIAMAVALPDICASLASEDGRTSPDKYKKWCADNLGDLTFVTADDLYSMRCGVLHNGRFGDLKHNVARVIFALPPVNGQASVFVDCHMRDAYFYSVVEFCKKITTTVHSWMNTNKDDANIRRNLPNLMQYRENGFPPYIVGATVLA